MTVLATDGGFNGLAPPEDGSGLIGGGPHTEYVSSQTWPEA